MCGIHLLINPLEDGTKAIRKMMDATAHRGPDCSGFSDLGQNVFLAGNRLKILDLSDASNQPFWSQNKDAVLVWNGALYNYQDLRNELLDLGYFFRTNSDSEVLLYWLMEFGSTKISALKGMYALIFANKKSGEITVARDPSGEKPLYFWSSGCSWCFSSETRGILAASTKNPVIDTDQFLPYFYFRHSFPDKTLYQNIQQILPGNGLMIPWNGENPKSIQWKKPYSESQAWTYSRFEKFLKDSVLKNFHAERPVGMILSGGADSSLLYAMWHEETGIPLSTYTATFEKEFQRKYEDPKFAQKLITRYPSHHHEVNITIKNVMENWDHYIRDLDQPIGDSAGFLTWMIAKEAKTEVKVLISGAGADELFAGYNRHQAYKKLLQNPNLFRFLQKFFTRFPLPGPLKKMLLSQENSLEQTYINYSALLPIPLKHQAHFTKWYPKSEDNFKNALEWDRTFYLVNDILKIQDTACMAHGIEGRSPYLDQELIGMSLNMSEKQHLELTGKTWIKEALNSRGLSYISKRKKLGFGLPLQEWLATDKEFRAWVFEPIIKMEKIWGKNFPEEMRKFASQPEKGVQNHFLIIWNLFLLASWLKQHNQ